MATNVYVNRKISTERKIMINNEKLKRVIINNNIEMAEIMKVK